jgi:tetratricopeptide (TPR) repeat protein
MRNRLLVLVAPAVLLAACASGPSEREQALAASTTADTPYGMFLAGNAALSDGRSSEAARFLDLARAQSGDETVAERAFNAALLAGAVERASGMAPAGPTASEPGKRLGRLVLAVDLMAQNKGKAAQEVLKSEALGFPHRSAAALLTPWAAAMAGDVDGSITRPEVRGDAMVTFFGQLAQAHLYERAKRYDEAETDFKAGMAGDTPSELVVKAYGEFLERRNRRKDAIAIYDAALKVNRSSAAMRIAKARAEAGKAAPQMPSLKEGAAMALLVPAASMIQAEQTPIGLAYLRLALHLDPQRNDAWLMLGDVLASSGDATGARAAYAKPKPAAPEFASAQAKLAWTYHTAGDKETALKLIRAAVANGDAEARLTLAEMLRAGEDYQGAADMLAGLIADGRQDDWRLYYSRAVVLDRLGRWPEAEKDLKKALELRPDEPELLNYLGYAWIDRGENLQQALGLVQKAVASNPRSGPMVDSLGWAYFRLGDYPKAVEKLEQAVELEAGDPEINNHLGDAYWMVGRKDEAVFQWRRVLTLKPDDKIKADAEQKLASGLGPKTAKLAGQ